MPFPGMVARHPLYEVSAQYYIISGNVLVKVKLLISMQFAGLMSSRANLLLALALAPVNNVFQGLPTGR